MPNIGRQQLEHRPRARSECQASDRRDESGQISCLPWRIRLPLFSARLQHAPDSLACACSRATLPLKALAVSFIAALDHCFAFVLAVCMQAMADTSHHAVLQTLQAPMSNLWRWLGAGVVPIEYDLPFDEMKARCAAALPAGGCLPAAHSEELA